MSDRITAGAGVLMASLSGLAWVARLWPVPTGRHRAPRRTPFALIEQAFRHCHQCGVETAAVIHPGAFVCAEGHLTITGRQR